MSGRLIQGTGGGAAKAREEGGTFGAKMLTTSFALHQASPSSLNSRIGPIADPQPGKLRREQVYPLWSLNLLQDVGI